MLLWNDSNGKVDQPGKCTRKASDMILLGGFFSLESTEWSSIEMWTTMPMPSATERAADERDCVERCFSFFVAKS